MTRQATQKEILNWTGIIFNPDNEVINDISLNWPKHRKIFIHKIAGYLYEDMRRAGLFTDAPFPFNKAFSRLTYAEKKFWLDYASEIPGKLRAINLFIRPYKDLCRTCIITDEEIEKFACMDRGAGKGFFKELNYLIPPQLKKIGYEIIRPEEACEIDIKLIMKLARAVHARYLQKMRNPDIDSEKDLNIPIFSYPGDTGNQYLTDFENLPDEIIDSNKDNVYHITTKLLSVGYKIRHVQKGFKSVTLHLNNNEIEAMARLEHIRWSWDKRLNGWIYGSVKDNENKIHPGLIPYEDLTEFEKEKDRELVRLIPALLQDINYEVYPINPDRIKKLSYAIKPQSSIHKILEETRAMNSQIRKLVTLTPEVENMVMARNRKIEDAIREVEGSYKYAQHI
jgi:hypothetical protein